MKNINFGLVLVLIIISGLINYRCEEEANQEPERYSFWKGDITNFYYCLDFNDARTHKITGKPYMILEYDPVTNIPLKCEFGLSDAKNEYLPDADMAIPEPFLSASSFEYADRLELTGSISLLCNWAPVSTHEQLSAGGFEFYVNKSGGEQLHFIFTFDSMEGEIINPDADWGDRVSDIKAFKLLRKFNSNTISN
jgi:hypothetical protein